MSASGAACSGSIDGFHLEYVRVQAAQNVTIQNSTFVPDAGTGNGAGSGKIFVTSSSASSSAANGLTLIGNTFGTVKGSYSIQTHANVQNANGWQIRNNNFAQPVMSPTSQPAPHAATPTRRSRLENSLLRDLMFGPEGRWGTEQHLTKDAIRFVFRLVTRSQGRRQFVPLVTTNNLLFPCYGSALPHIDATPRVRRPVARLKSPPDRCGAALDQHRRSNPWVRLPIGATSPTWRSSLPFSCSAQRLGARRRPASSPHTRSTLAAVAPTRRVGQRPERLSQARLDDRG